MQEFGLGPFILGVLTLAFLGVLVLIRTLGFVSAFKAELRYLNREIRRTVGDERRYWIRRRRRLWLSLIPFVKY